MNRPCALLLPCIIGISAAALPASAQDVDAIVAKSAAAVQADWKAAPEFSFTEHDVIVKGGARTVKTYRVVMIDGSPYNKLVTENGRPLPADQAAAEEQKLQQAAETRRSEGAAARQKRIAQYKRERAQDQALLMEMTRAFTYRLAGHETVNGHDCYRVDAEPKPGYVPKSRDTKVLTGMRGTMWIDTKTNQWVKVTASVFRPVSFGLFIARVRPGTEFTLEQGPVAGTVWLPTHFVTKVNARVLVWSKQSSDDETYSDYSRS
jgi:hypothetical protein